MRKKNLLLIAASIGMMFAASNVYSQTTDVDVHVKVTCPNCPKGTPTVTKPTPGTFKPDKLVPNDWPRKPRQPYNPPRLPYNNPPAPPPTVINNVTVPPPTVIVVQAPAMNTFAPPTALAAPMAAPPPPAPIPADLSGSRGPHISALGWVAISLGAAVVLTGVGYGIHRYCENQRNNDVVVVKTDPDPPHNSTGTNPGDPGTHKPGRTDGGGTGSNYRYSAPAMQQPTGLVLMRF